MSWALRFRVAERLRSALWPVACVSGLLGLLAGMIVWRLDRWVGWSLFAFTQGAATALIASAVGATLTFLGTAFAVLLVVIQVAGTQLTPRVLTLSLNEPQYKVTLGLFVATFVYSMVIIGRITETFVPQLSIGLAMVLLLGSLGAYVVLISALPHRLRPVVVSARIARQGCRAIERIYPVPFGRPDAAIPQDDRTRAGKPPRVLGNPGPPGIVLAIDVDGLLAEASRSHGHVMVVPAVGDFVRTGAPLFHLYEPADPMDERRLLGSVALGEERTIDHDVQFAFRILVDIALKGLSPGINDPTSAVMAVGQIHELLAWLGVRRLDVGQRRDADGHVRLTIPMPRWEDYLSLALDEIRHFGIEQFQVTRRLRAMLEDLAKMVPGERKTAVQHELDLLGRAVRRAFPDAEDQARASLPDDQGVGSPLSP